MFLCAAVYCVLEAERLVYLTKIIQGLVDGVRVCCCVLCVGGRALGVSDQDYPRASGWCSRVLLCTVCWRQNPWCTKPRLSKGLWPVCICVAVYCVLEAEPLVYLTMIIQGLMAGVLVCCCVLCDGGRSLGVSDQDYTRAV